jgi:hypothetical protein
VEYEVTGWERAEEVTLGSLAGVYCERA